MGFALVLHRGKLLTCTFGPSSSTQTFKISRPSTLSHTTPKTSAQRSAPHPKNSEHRSTKPWVKSSKAPNPKPYTTNPAPSSPEVTANLRNSLLLYAVSTASAAVWKFIADLRGDVHESWS